MQLTVGPHFNILYDANVRFLKDIGVIIAALIMWKLKSPSRFYADPAASLAISFIIFASALPIS